jgi:ribose transport system substrate-binding protein
MVLAVGLGLVVFPSCARQTETGERIAVFTKNQTNPLFQVVRLGADSAARQMHATVVHYVPTQPDSIPEQMSQIEDAITKRPSAVVFVPVDSKAMVPGVQKMNAAGIPVVNIVDHSLGGEILSWVGADEHIMALDGRYLSKARRKGNVIIIEGVADRSAAPSACAASSKRSRSSRTSSCWRRSPETSSACKPCR